MDLLPYEVRQPYYEALGLQFEDFNRAQDAVIKFDGRFPLIVGGERAGKSFASAAVLLPHLDLLPQVKPEKFYDEEGRIKFDWKDRQDRPLDPHFVIFGPNYAETRVEFRYLEQWCKDLDILARVYKPTEGMWRLITKDGVVLNTWSTEIPTSIRAIDLEGAMAVEAGIMKYDAIERIQGRISAQRGFCIYNGTMENAERWYINWSIEGERENRWGVKTFKIPSWSNLHQYPGGRNDDEILRLEEFYGGAESDTFLVRVAAEPIPPRDRVIREFTANHIRSVELPRDSDGELECDIDLAIDPGYLPSAYAALWVASWTTPQGKFFYVFDELYEQKIGNREAIDWIKKHKFRRYLNTAERNITIDTAVKRHIDGNEPAINIFRDVLGITPYAKYWHENSLIERIRTTANQNMIAIDPKCTGLIAELGLGDPVFPGMHPWKFPSSKDGTILSDKPRDAWNHSAKALGYLLLRKLGLVEQLGSRPKNWNRLEERRPAKRNYLTGVSM